MDARKSSNDSLPGDLQDCHRLIAALQSQVQQQATALSQQKTALSFKDKLTEEQAHSVLQLKADNDKLEEQNVELTLKVEKLLRQLLGRRSERRVDGEGQLFLDLAEEASPEVVSALEEAIREAEQIVNAAEEEKRKQKPKRPRHSDRKFPEHLPRIEKTIDLPPEQREGLKLIGYDEVETLEWIRPKLQVRLNKYAKYAHRSDKTQGIRSPERPTGLVEGDRYDASVAVEVVA